jgi:succinoglycan biosynthesis protein ExoA
LSEASQHLLPSSLPAAPGGGLADPSAAALPLFISVVVPVRNEAQCIERTLQCLLSQDYDPSRFEILVIDGESSDGTPEIVARMARRHAQLRLFNNPRRLSSAARNVGIRNARGEVILVIDGHCELRDRRHLRLLAAAFQQSGADAVGRPQPLDISGATAFQRAIAAARSSRLGHHPDSFIYSTAERFVPASSVAVAYRRAVFERIGCFDERFDACEDVELNHRLDRAGLRCFFTPAVAVAYVPRDSLCGLFRQLARYGRGRIRLLRKHPGTFSLGSMVPLAFVVGLLAGGLASLAAARIAVAYGAVLALYAAIVLGTSAAIALRQRRPSLLVLLPPLFATIHVASGAGMLLELARPAPRPASIEDGGAPNAFGA